MERGMYSETKPACLLSVSGCSSPPSLHYRQVRAGFRDHERLQEAAEMEAGDLPMSRPKA